MRKLLLFTFATFLFYSCKKNSAPDTLFLKLDPRVSHLDFSNNLTESEELNIIEYLYFYNGGGVAAGDINNDGLPDLFFTSNQEENQLYLNKGLVDGKLQFENISQKAGIAGSSSWSTGVNMVDINSDGLLDIYVNNVSKYKQLKGANELYINNGDLTFTESAKGYHLDISGFCTQTAFFDYDKDGDLDAYVLRHAVHDATNYGDTSLRNVPDSLAGDLLLENRNGKFVDQSRAAGIWNSRLGYGLGLAIGDVNNDSWPDVYVGNDFHENDYLYYNNQDGTFTEGISSSMGHTNQFSMGNDLADINNDGLLDLIALDMKPEEEPILKTSALSDPYDIFEFKASYGYHYQYARNVIQLNRGNLLGDKASFSEIGQLLGLDATDWSWSALWADYDLDGKKDLFVTNGILRRPIDLDYLKFLSNPESAEVLSDLELLKKMPDGAAQNYSFKNKSDKELKFTNTGQGWGLNEKGFSNGAAYADLDNDGDLDLVINNLNEKASIFINQSIEKGLGHFLKLKLEGDNHNKYGIGARVYIFRDGNLQTAELQPSRGFQSSVEPFLYFGFNSNKKIDSLNVVWPSGKSKSYFDITVDQELLLKEQDATGKFDQSSYLNSHFEPIKNSGIDFQHQENRFFDNNREGLIPHLLSTQGPALASGDVNNDGLSDLYLGGAAGQSGALYLQKQNGQFIKSLQTVFQVDRDKEDTEALFFDADGNGHLDLFVQSGGNEHFGQSDLLLDRLYLNNGNGRFSKKSLPSYHTNGGAIACSDYDADGDLDLFVGGRSMAYNYGLSPQSHLLENDGQGNYKIASNDFAKQLIQIGMVNDAAWINLDEDEKKELVLTGEWMPVIIFDWDGSNWTKKELPASSGWWNKIAHADFDGDGDQDLVIGNLGLNSNLKASQEEPLGLYIKDFDENKSNDPILTYYREGTEYIVVGKDQLIGQLAPLRKKYVGYEEYATSNVQQVFENSNLQDAKYLKTENLATTYFENQGNLSFASRPLPQETQYAPVQAIAIEDVNQDGSPDLLMGGNFFEVQPYIGRYDASYGNVLLNNGNGGFTSQSPQESGFVMHGQIRGIQVLDSPKGKIIVAARNNDQPLIYILDRPFR